MEERVHSRREETVYCFLAGEHSCTNLTDDFRRLFTDHRRFHFRRTSTIAGCSLIVRSKATVEVVDSVLGNPKIAGLVPLHALRPIRHGTSRSVSSLSSRRSVLRSERRRQLRGCVEIRGDCNWPNLKHRCPPRRMSFGHDGTTRPSIHAVTSRGIVRRLRQATRRRRKDELLQLHRAD